jgi:hypothetical protein
MTFLWCVAVFFGAMFFVKAGWLFYLLVIKREGVNDIDAPASGWGSPELGPMKLRRIDDTGRLDASVAGGIGVQPVVSPTCYPDAAME